MGIAIGSGSYLAFGQQSAFRTVQTSLTTSSFVRTGSVFSARDSLNEKTATTGIMAKADQVWRSLALVDFDATFEYVANDTVFLPLLTAVWGRRLKVGGGAPFVHTYAMWNPPVDGGTDNTPTGTFYNHSLTVREVLSDGANALSPRVVQDICIDRFVLTMEANKQLTFQVTGTGQNYAASSAPGFTDATGTTMSYLHANQTGSTPFTSGVFLGTANPPVSPMLAKSIIFTLENNLAYDPYLGALTGQDMKTPVRAGRPSAAAAVSMDFEDTTGTDAVSLMTDFFASTRENFRIEYYVDANNSLELLCSGSSAAVIIDDPKPVYSGEGKVGFTFNAKMLPNSIGNSDATTDQLKMVQATGT